MLSQYTSAPSFLNPQAAVRKFDQTVCELIKRCNALQHVKQSREQTLASLEMQLTQIQKESETTATTPAG